MRIFFTGGSGKAGHHVAPYLASLGHQVTNADLTPLGDPDVADLRVDRLQHELAPGPVLAERQDVVGQVVARRDAVEHRRDVGAPLGQRGPGTGPGPRDRKARATGRQARPEGGPPARARLTIPETRRRAA